MADENDNTVAAPSAETPKPDAPAAGTTTPNPVAAGGPAAGPEQDKPAQPTKKSRKRQLSEDKPSALAQAFKSVFGPDKDAKDKKDHPNPHIQLAKDLQDTIFQAHSLLWGAIWDGMKSSGSFIKGAYNERQERKQQEKAALEAKVAAEAKAAADEAQAEIEAQEKAEAAEAELMTEPWAQVLDMPDKTQAEIEAQEKAEAAEAELMAEPWAQVLDMPDKTQAEIEAQEKAEAAEAEAELMAEPWAQVLDMPDKTKAEVEAQEKAEVEAQEKAEVADKEETLRQWAELPNISDSEAGIEAQKAEDAAKILGNTVAANPNLEGIDKIPISSSSSKLNLSSSTDNVPDALVSSVKDSRMTEAEFKYQKVIAELRAKFLDKPEMSDEKIVQADENAINEQSAELTQTLADEPSHLLKPLPQETQEEIAFFQGAPSDSKVEIPKLDKEAAGSIDEHNATVTASAAAREENDNTAETKETRSLGA